MARASARPACVPGATALTSKSAAAAAAAAAYGDGGHAGLAASIDLPRRTWDAVAAVAGGEGVAPPHSWALKTIAHRGAGVTVLDGGQLNTATAVPHVRSGVLQSFIEPQARLAAPDAAHGSPPARFYIRAWALLTAGAPSPRAYLFNGGFAISAGAPGDDRVVNLWLAGRDASTVVRVSDLPRHVVPPPRDATVWSHQLHRDMEAAFGAALAAAAPTLVAAADARPPGSVGAQLIGADFAVTPEGRAVLLEINETPSFARMGKAGRENAPSESTAAFDGEKEAAAAALVAFVAKTLERDEEAPSTVRCSLDSVDSAAVRAAAAEAAAARATGWSPLAPAVVAGLEAATTHAATTTPRPLWRRTLRACATSRLGVWCARALAGAAPRALALIAQRGADAGVLGSPDPMPPDDDIVAAARLLAECA